MQKISTQRMMSADGIFRRISALVILALLLPAVAFAQKGQVDDFHEETGGILAMSKLKKDNNGRFCALLKIDVRTPEGVVDKDVVFTGNIVGQATLQGSQYWVYVPTSIPNLTLESNTLKPLTINFNEYPDIQFSEKRIYTLEVSTQGPQGQYRVPTHSFRLTVSPAESSVIVDDTEYELNNGQVDIPMAPGLHRYTIKCNDYKTEIGTFMMQNKHYPLSVQLKSENGALVKPFRQGAKWGFKDQNGKTLVQPKYDQMFAAGDLYWVVDKRKYGMFDNEGNQLTPFAYKDVVPLNDEGLFKVQSASSLKFGIVDSKGHVTAECVHEDIVRTSSPLYVLLENGRYGAINSEGQIVLPCIYDQIVDFRQGYALIKKDNKIGYINEKGEIIIPCQYDRATHFNNGRAEVNQGGYVFYIDIHGNRISD